MEAEWIADWATLRWLVRHHPDWTQAELASAVGRSRSWVVKWLARLKDTAPDDLAALFSRSRACRTPQVLHLSQTRMLGSSASSASEKRISYQPIWPACAFYKRSQ